MASIFKPKGSDKYVINYTDENGRRRKAAGTSDKAVTKQIASKLEGDVALRRRGILDKDAERFAEARQRRRGRSSWVCPGKSGRSAIASRWHRGCAMALSTERIARSWPA
jgi:hypothetical protein